MIAAPASLSIGIAAALAAALLALVLGVNRPEDTLFWSDLFQFGHVPVFGILALLLRELLRRCFAGWSSVKCAVSAFCLTMAAGLVTEAVHAWMPRRHASWDDVLLDALGAATALVLQGAWSPAAPESGPARGVRWLATLAGLAALVLAASPLGVTATRYFARAQALPVLFRLDGSWRERPFVRCGESATFVAMAAPRTADSGEALAELQLQPALYPGLVLAEPYPDWSGYRELRFTAGSDRQEPLTVVLRIHDADHDGRFEDRFNGQIVLQPGVNDVSLPLAAVEQGPRDRPLDLRRVREIVLFVHRLEQPVRLRLGNFRLER